MRADAMVLDGVAERWWAFVLRGAAGIVFGILTFLAPAISLAALVLLFGAYAFVDGAFAMVSAFRRRDTHERWWALLLQGMAGVAAGVLAVVWPDITAVALLYLVAAWALVTGGFEVAAAIRLRKVIEHEWLLAASGIASMALGVVLFLFPGPAALALVIWIGAYALVSGVLLVVVGFKLRSKRSGRTSGSPQPAHAVG